ncbi:MAG: hypothetical protein IJ313_00570 [Clostridia bacterium]|nr:hypothetical protein [Clostridia bacterium]
MAAIPRALYAYIEKKLYDQPYQAVSEAAEALISRREEATGVKSPSGERSGGHSSGVSNRVQDGVLRVIAAEETLETANRWAFVYMRLGEIFDGTGEGEVARMLYAQKMTAQEIAKHRGVDRQTVRRLRDSYVIRAALLAAEHGLVRTSDYADG